MTYYYILLLLYFVLGIVELSGHAIKNRSLYTFALIFPMFFLAAFRSIYIGNDTIVYYNAYESISTHTNFTQVIAESRLEKGYLFLCYCFKQFGLSYYQLQIFISCIIYFSLFRFFKKYASNIALCSFLFMASLKMGATMNTVRMYLAISILLVSIDFIIKRIFIKFIFTVLIASSFHTSALIFLLMYPLCIMRRNKYIIGAMVVGSAVIMYLGVTFFSWLTESIDLYENYVTDERFNEMNTLAVTINLIICMSIFAFALYVGYFKGNQYEMVNGFEKKGKAVTFDYFIMMSMYILVSLSIVGLTNTLITRVTSYFSISMILIIPYCINRLNRQIDQLMIYLLCTSFYFLHFLVILTYRPNWNRIIPYEFFFT